MGTDSSAQQSKQRGFSLVESAIVLAVVGLVIGGIWIARAAMYENYKVNKTIEDMITIARNAQSLISIRDADAIGNVVRIDTTLQNAGAIPEDWIQSGGIKNPFGGSSHFTNMSHSNWAAIEIWMYGIPKSACISLVVRMSTIGSTAKDGGTAVQNKSALGYLAVYPLSSNPGSVITSNSFPVSLDTATAACTLATGNTMTFAFAYTRTN